MNIEETMIAIDGRTGPIAAMTRTVGNMGGVGAAGHLPVGCAAAHVERGARGRGHHRGVRGGAGRSHGLRGRFGRVAQIGHHQDVADQHCQEVVECGMTGIHDGDDVTC